MTFTLQRQLRRARAGAQARRWVTPLLGVALATPAATPEAQAAPRAGEAERAEAWVILV
jgi:hypothetical protein